MMPLSIMLILTVGGLLSWTAAQRGRARTTLVRTVSARRLPRVVSGALVLAAAAVMMPKGGGNRR